MIATILTYMFASSTMLLINKIAINTLQRPLMLLYLQLSFASMAVTLAHDLKVIRLTTPSMDILKKFWLVPVMFLISIFCNIMILSHTNIETFIVLRASTPIVISILDVQFLGKALPDRRSWVSIIGVFICALFYVSIEKSQFTVDSIFWLVSWYCVFCFDQIYIKHVCETVQMTSWDRVWYTNTVPVVILFPLVLFIEDNVTINVDDIQENVSVVFSSCVMGVLMSYASFWARKEMSATAFSVIGNVCKVVSILLNYFVWDNHASLSGIAALMGCIGFAAFYRQAGKDRDGKDKKKLKNYYIGAACMLVCIILLTY